MSKVLLNNIGFCNGIWPDNFIYNDHGKFSWDFNIDLLWLPTIIIKGFSVWTFLWMLKKIWSSIACVVAAEYRIIDCCCWNYLTLLRVSFLLFSLYHLWYFSSSWCCGLSWMTSSLAMHFFICVPMPNLQKLNPTTLYT